MKVLILSHNPITTFDAMGKTFLTLFSQFKKEELCQFYIYPTIPDVEACNSYFRITDKDVLNSYFKFKVKGKEISKEEIQNASSTLFEEKKDEGLYRNKKNKSPFRILLRDLMWKMSSWNNKSLNNWIKRENPTHLFVAPGAAKFIYDIALKISKKYNLPIITYLCDEYYFREKEKSFLGKIKQKKLQKKIEKLMQKTTLVVGICDKIKQVYCDKFNLNGITVMTGSNFEIKQKPLERRVVNELTYMGNVRCNRYLSLSKIGQAIDSINAKNCTDYVLNIWTAEKDQEILAELGKAQCIKLCGFVSGEEFNKTFKSAECLVHVEAFDNGSIDLVKHSVSTKIADSLGSGIPFFCYAPKEVASCEYLISNDCAICATEESELEEKLLQLFTDETKREQVVNNALNTARQNHEKTLVSQKLYQGILGVGNENSSS